MKLTLIAFLSIVPASITACPALPDSSEQMAELVAAARIAETEMDGRKIGREMWKIWFSAPDEPAQSILDEGLAKMSSRDLLGAVSDFDILIEYCPHYAEGYNQRAFAFYLNGQYERAVSDLTQAILLRPDHVAARAGMALSLLKLGRLDEARTELEAALELNPWLSERALLAPGGPLDPKGRDI